MFFHFISVCEGPNTHAVFVRWLSRAGCRMAPLQFFKVWDLEGCGHTRGFINFFGVLAYIAFLWTVGCFSSTLNCGYIKYTLNFLEENTLHVA
jgi:hypothetical protein